jgi:hypothetical protein
LSRFAEGTEVSPEKSKMEIERILARYGATSFASGWQNGRAVIAFTANNRHVKFVLPLPDKTDKNAPWRRKKNDGWSGPSDSAVQVRYDAEVRRLWRALALAIKAKLEVVDSGIASFEHEFMAHIVMPNGSTVGDWMEPQIENAYRSGNMPPLLYAGNDK